MRRCLPHVPLTPLSRAGADTAAALLARLRALQRTRGAGGEQGDDGGHDCAICLAQTPPADAATLDCCTHRFCFDCNAAFSGAFLQRSSD